MNYVTKKAIVETALLFGSVIAAALPLTYLESRTEKKRIVEEQRQMKIENRLDSLMHIDNLASRLDGYSSEAAYFGGYNFIDSLQKRYEAEGKKLEISFEEYLTTLYVEQQKMK